MQRRALLAALAALPAPALAFPERSVALVVPFAPGGSTDISARVVAERMGAALGTRVVVENRAGAGGVVGAEHVRRAAPDGHTLLFASASSHAANPALMPDLPYDAVRDFAAAALTGISPMALIVAPSGPADLPALRRDLADGRGTYASAGQGSIPHLATELFLSRSGLRAEHIPYRSGGEALGAVTRGEVPFAFEAAATLTGAVRDGRVRALAVTTLTRAPVLPTVAPLAELGFPGFDLGTWNAVLAPAGTDPARLRAIAAAALAAIAEPEVVRRLTDLGVTVPPPMGPEETTAFVAAEVAKFRAIVRDAGIRLERS
jgi:tripartite-type tricarboxylate transporter receptor subunit TctC